VFGSQLDRWESPADWFSAGTIHWFSITNISTHSNNDYPDGVAGAHSSFNWLAGSLPGDWFAWPPDPSSLIACADPTTGQQDLPTQPIDAETTDDLILNLLCYAGPTSAGDPSGVTIADPTATPPVDPLPVIHQEVWTKGATTLMVQLSQTRAVNHATDVSGTGTVMLQERVFVDNGGPINIGYPPSLAEDSTVRTELSVGLGITFRVRTPVTRVAVPSRLATIVG
jgi:hypothetical protein